MRTAECLRVSEFWFEDLGLRVWTAVGFWPRSEDALCPDVISYNATISSCQRGSEWQLAVQLFHAMPDAGPGFIFCVFFVVFFEVLR